MAELLALDQGTSIPATEHSVMTAWPSEKEAILNTIEKYGDGLFACVMDSYDYDHALDVVLPVRTPNLPNQEFPHEKQQHLKTVASRLKPKSRGLNVPLRYSQSNPHQSCTDLTNHTHSRP